MEFKDQPKITVIVPTLNRPELAKIAVDSVLRQSTRYSIQLILSNNGGNQNIRETFKSNSYKNKIEYIETEEILPMPAHWEWASTHAAGEYLMILPDRRLLKQGAIEQLVSVLDKNPDCDACCCCDEWLFESGRIVTTKTFSENIKLSTKKILHDFEVGLFDRNCLPLGLNSILRVKLVQTFRARNARYFDEISPDFRSAFNFLFNAKNIYVMAEPLMLTTGFNLSNGGKAYQGDRSYWNGLGAGSRFKHMPRAMEGNVWASIYEDYLRSKYVSQGIGDYTLVMTKTAMSHIMTEEFIKMIVSGFKNNWHRFLEIRKIMQVSGWTHLDDVRIIGNILSGLRQFTPLSVKKIYRRIYSWAKGGKIDLFNIAGFDR